MILAALDAPSLLLKVSELSLKNLSRLSWDFFTILLGMDRSKSSPLYAGDLVDILLLY